MAVTGPGVGTRARWGKVSTWLEERGDRELFLLVFAPLLAIYLATATYSYPLINDAFSNSATAWSIANNGSVYLDDFEGHEETYGFISWIVPGGDSIVSKYPPGAALLATPFYAAWPQDVYPTTYQPEDIDEFWQEVYPVLTEPTTRVLVPVAPGAFTAAVSTAVATGLLAVVFRRLSDSVTLSAGPALVFGLGTSAWPVAADQLWQHGPAMLWVALALFLSQGHLLGSGLAFGAAILTRPPLAIIAAGAGLMRSWRERSMRPALLVGAGSVAGLAAFLVYNGIVFGDPSISAGYGPVFENKVVSGLDVGRYLRTIFDALFSREVGILVYSPFLLVLLPGLRAAWRVAPAWARGAALGGVVYLLVQYKANRATGGDFIGYRYPLEPLLAAAPLFFLACKECIARRPSLRRPLILAIGISVLVQGLGAFGIGVI
jgi:hypothetical protein